MTAPARFPVLGDEAVERLVAAVRGNPVAMVNCARTLLMESGRNAQARALCREALALDPADGEAAALARPVLSEGIGGWYFTMLLDARRHALYERALRRMLVGGGVVLDIGAGTGLFAMMAARAGASRVIACERDPEVARIAAEIVARNGLSDRVEVLALDARELVLREPADMLLWDNLANNFLGAGCAATLADAKARLLRKGAQILPGRAEIMVAPATDLNGTERHTDRVEGFDMTPFNALRATDFTLSPTKFELRAEPVAMFDLDVTGPDPIRPARASIEVTASAGRIDGIAQWLRFHLGDGLVYETLGEDVQAFGPQFHVTDPFTAAEGKRLRLAGAHDTLNTWFWIDR